ncbi:uncharacterized protein [Mytilus edulis]|uniref:uncharacterized protein n=1 Tax=Mytilus edulis TaxID=6550 RepID=UPI0039EE0777
MPKIAVLLPEETNYLRIANLMLRVAPPAVRVQFNNEFHPDKLQGTLKEQRFKILESLKGKRIINKPQWDKLFPKTDEVSSNSFDLMLMICLIRHLIPVDVGDFFPVDPKNISLGADLSRLKYYRNQVAHSEAGVLTDKTFENYWNDITQVVNVVKSVKYNFEMGSPH